MRRLSKLAPLLAFLLGIFAVAGMSPAAFAFSENGSHAWSSRQLTLRNGPGTVYEEVGTVKADVEIKVLRCQRLWCLVDSGPHRGWAVAERIVFGRTSTNWPGGIHPDYPSGGGTVCLFEGTHYTGASVCAGPGRVFNDLALLDVDNHFGSIQINGNVTAAACRDRGFQSYCERIIESQPVLGDHLRNALTSVRVY